MIAEEESHHKLTYTKVWEEWRYLSVRESKDVVHNFHKFRVEIGQRR